MSRFSPGKFGQKNSHLPPARIQRVAWSQFGLRSPGSKLYNTIMPLLSVLNLTATLLNVGTRFIYSCLGDTM